MNDGVRIQLTKCIFVLICEKKKQIATQNNHVTIVMVMSWHFFSSLHMNTAYIHTRNQTPNFNEIHLWFLDELRTNCMSDHKPFICKSRMNYFSMLKKNICSRLKTNIISMFELDSIDVRNVNVSFSSNEFKWNEIKSSNGHLKLKTATI